MDFPQHGEFFYFYGQALPTLPTIISVFIQDLGIEKKKYQYSKMVAVRATE
jgi:hypothetical protein